MSQSTHVTALASWDAERGRLALDDQMSFHARMRKLKPGAGERFVIVVLNEQEAARHGQRKHLHGHLLKPTSDWTGYSVTELKAEMKALFLPDGMTSTEQMNAEEYDEFNRAVEQCIREEYPSECWEKCLDAMALSDLRRTA